MTEEEVVSEIRKCVGRLNELSKIAGQMGIEFEFDELEIRNHHDYSVLRSVNIKKVL